jgi:hypothetical protein
MLWPAVVLLGWVPKASLVAVPTVTLKVACAELPEPSVTATVWFPAVALLGTLKVQDPLLGRLPLVLVEHVPEIVRLLPSQVAVTVLEAANPEPVIATPLVPAAPELGVSTMAGVTVKVAVGALVPSLAVTVWLPATAAGTVKEQLLDEGSVPLELVVQVPVVDCVVPSNFTVIVLLALKPVPETVTLLPTLPEVGERLIEAATVKVAVAELLDPSTP